jgi:ribosome maturation factor RimP
MSPCLLNMAVTIEQIYQILEPVLDDTDIFIISIKIKPINNIKVFLDADSGLSIEKCALVNRKLYHQIEAMQFYPEGDFSLEVSSPGVDEPLTQLRQYKKNIGRKLSVTDVEDKETVGILKNVEDDFLTLEVKIPKKKDTEIKDIPFLNIKKSVVQIIF